MFSVLVIRLRSLRLLRVSGIVMRLRMFLLLITFLKASHSFRKVIRDRKSGSAGMPRPISYAVFCLKKKIVASGGQHNEELSLGVRSRACGRAVARSSRHRDSRG